MSRNNQTLLSNQESDAREFSRVLENVARERQVRDAEQRQDFERRIKEQDQKRPPIKP